VSFCLLDLFEPWALLHWDGVFLFFMVSFWGPYLPLDMRGFGSDLDHRMHFSCLGKKLFFLIIHG
jgi:hypothetical protein